MTGFAILKKLFGTLNPAVCPNKQLITHDSKYDRKGKPKLLTLPCNLFFHFKHREYH